MAWITTQVPLKEGRRVLKNHGAEATNSANERPGLRALVKSIHIGISWLIGCEMGIYIIYIYICVYIYFIGNYHLDRCIFFTNWSCFLYRNSLKIHLGIPRGERFRFPTSTWVVGSIGVVFLGNEKGPTLLENGYLTTIRVIFHGLTMD